MDIKGVSNFIAINLLVKLSSTQPGIVFSLLHLSLPRAPVRFKQQSGGDEHALYVSVVVPLK